MGVDAGRFVGRTVFVTGAAHGIGLATATAFASEGAAVYLFDVSEDWLPEAVERVGAQNGGHVASFRGDVRSRGDIDDAVRHCELELGPIAVCINNVAIGGSTHTLNITDSEWHEMIDIGLTGNFRVAQAVSRRMLERRDGVIISTSSTSAIASEPGHAHYGAVKAGVLALTRVLARELAPHGVRACAICPGQVDTRPWPNIEFQRLYNARIAAGRGGNASEIATVFLYLASDDARHLNGVVFIADGGMLAWE